jgi:peroxiredoxin
MIERGNAIPSVGIKLVNASGIAETTSDAVLGSGTVVLFSVPGAFTPTCHVNHLPGFLANAIKLKAKGVDRIICVAANDAHVMKAWADSQDITDDSIVMLADGNGELTKALGLVLDGSGFGLGERSQRYSMLVKDGVVEQLNIEQGGEFKVSSAEHLLAQL